MDKAEKATGNAIQTERLDIVPSVEPCDLDRYLSDLLSTNDFYCPNSTLCSHERQDHCVPID